jgi:hypothetical protein
MRDDIVTVYYNPQPGITEYEIALILAASSDVISTVSGFKIRRRALAALPSLVRCHVSFDSPTERVDRLELIIDGIPLSPDGPE